MKDERLVVRGNPDHPITRGFLCPKGNLLPSWFHSTKRLKKPLLRDSLEDKFRSVGWDEAISKIAEKMKEVIEEYGSESILVYNYAGDRGIVNYAYPLRLFHYLNASVIEDGICSRAGKEALKDVYGTFIGLDPEELRNQKLIVYWGVNPFWTNLHGFRLAEKFGIERWVVDVLRTETAKRCERFIQIKPESDIFLALGIAKIIVENELYDADFIEKNVYGFEEFKKYVSNLDLDVLSRETGLGKEEMEKLSFEYAEKKGIIHIGYGLQRSLSGGEAVRAISILPALVGHSFGFIYSHSIDKSYAEGVFLRSREVRKIPQMKLCEFIERGEIKLLYIYNSNPFASLPNQNRLRRAVREKEVFVILHDIFFTETALYSHVVLPSNTFFERLDIADSFYHRYIALNQPLAKLFGKSNSEVTRMIAERMGINDPHLKESDEEVIRKVLEMNGIDYEKLKERGFIKIPEKRRFYNTKSGKIEFYSNRAVERGLSPLPRPVKRERGSLKLLTPTWNLTITSQYRNIHGISDASLYLNPTEAKKRGVRENELVEVFNENGSIKAIVKLTEDVPEDVALIYKSFPRNIRDRNVNFLTSDETNEVYGEASTYHSTWVELRKIHE
jgi:anaerobic selenocysteine-containing dehydrogenase